MKSSGWWRMKTIQLERECRTYTRYLVGQNPTKYVIEHYIDFHCKSDALNRDKLNGFDQFLVVFSGRNYINARLADCYTSLFCKESVVRKKLVLTLALLECTPPFFVSLDRVDRGGTIGAIARLARGVVQYVLALAVSVVLFTPVRLVIALSSQRREAAVSGR